MPMRHNDVLGRSPFPILVVGEGKEFESEVLDICTSAVIGCNRISVLRKSGFGLDQ